MSEITTTHDGFRRPRVAKLGLGLGALAAVGLLAGCGGSKGTALARAHTAPVEVTVPELPPPGEVVPETTTTVPPVTAPPATAAPAATARTAAPAPKPQPKPAAPAPAKASAPSRPSAPAAPAPPSAAVARLNPSSAELQQAMRTLQPRAPSSRFTEAHAREFGNQVCNGFDQGMSHAQVKKSVQQALAQAGMNMFSSADIDAAIRTAVQLFCPGHQSKLPR